MEFTVCISTGFLSSLTVITALGVMIFLISAKKDFTRISPRETLKPPPVEPAQAPMIMSSTSVCLENSGQKLKSTVAKPVVVMMLAT